MLNMIKADLYRIFKGKAIYVSILIIIGMLLLSTIGMTPGHIGLSTNTVSMSSEELTDEELNEKIYNANSLTEIRKIMKEYGSGELDKQLLGTNVNLYYLFIVIVVIVLTTDFSNSTIKNTLSSAISRKKYYVSKLGISILLSTLLVMINNYGGYFLNLMINGSNFSSNLSELTKITLYQMPLMYGIISLLVCISAVTRKTSIFNSISIPLIMGFQLIVLASTSLFRIDASKIMNYEFQYALSNLATNPTTSYIVKCMSVGIAYIIIFNIIGYYSFKNAEIK